MMKATFLLVAALLFVSAVVESSSINNKRRLDIITQRHAAIKLNLKTDQPGWTAFGGGDDHSGFRNETLGKITQFRLKWETNASAGMTFTQPIVYGGYVVSMTQWLNVMYVLNATTGEVVQQCVFNPQYSFSWPNIAIDGSVLLQGSTDIMSTFVIAIDMETCETNWVSPNYPYQPALGTYPFGVANSKQLGVMYAPSGFTNNEMFAVSAVNGSKLFNSTLYNTTSAPDSWGFTVLSDNRVLFSSGLGQKSLPMIGEINALNGSVLWARPLNASDSVVGSSVWWVPVAANNIALGIAIKNVSNVSLSAVLMDAGKQFPIMWKSENCAWRYNSDTTPATDGVYAYLTCMDSVRAFDLQTGKLTQKYAPCKWCSGQPIVLNDFLFVKANDGLLAFNKKTGALVAQTNETADFIAYAGKTLFVSRMFSGSIKAYTIE